MSKIILYMLGLIVVSSTVLGNTTPTGSSRDYFSPANILKFADYLYDSGDFIRAAGEYQRYLYMLPSENNNDAVYYKSIKALFQGGEYDRCLNLLHNFKSKYPRSGFLDKTTTTEAIIRYYQNNYRAAIAAAKTEGDYQDCRKQIVIGMSYLKLNMIDSAKIVICQGDLAFDDSFSDYENCRRNIKQLCNKVAEAGSLSYKSPVSAGLLSTVIPGMGKIYCGRTTDGLYSLLLIGLSGWQAYDGFDKDGSKSTKGWIFASLGSVFYLGNIYGSVVSAKIYNRRIYKDFLKGVEIEISLP